MAVAAAHGMGGGLNAVGHLLRALHALRPSGRAVGRGRGGVGGYGSFSGGGFARDGAARSLEGCTASGLIAGFEAVGGPRGGAAQRRDGGLRTSAGDSAKTRGNACGTGLPGRAEAVGGGGSSRQGSPATGGGGCAACERCAAGGNGADAGGSGRYHAAGRKPCADGRARAELRAAGDEAVGDAGTENAEPEQ